MPGGADWQYVRADGVLELEARYSIKTKDGAEIAVINRGMRRASPEIMDRLSRGEAVDPALVYFRTAPVFEAPAGPYAVAQRKRVRRHRRALPRQGADSRLRSHLGPPA